MHKLGKTRHSFKDALEQLEQIISEDLYQHLQEVVAFRGALPCILCGRLTWDGGIYLPYRNRVRASVYGLCEKCFDRPQLLAEIESRIQRRLIIGQGRED